MDTGRRQGLDLIPGDRTTATAQIVINAENRPIDSVYQICRPLSKEYDYLVFDTAPSVGGIQERAIFAADLVLLPTATEFLSMDGLAQMMRCWHPTEHFKLGRRATWDIAHVL
jgi:chromosome partitioning protein